MSWVVALGPSGYVAAQVAGSATFGVAVEELKAVALVGAGGFVGLRRHDIVIPVSQLKQQDGKFMLASVVADRG